MFGMSDPFYRVTLAKEDFKFSAAHFTLFPDGTAELLHGHNYQVALEVSGRRLDEFGLLVDFARVKGLVRRLCAELDSRTLIPEHSPHLELRRLEGAVEVGFGRRLYRLPEDDVLLLPLTNSSIELLARLFWQRLAAELARWDPPLDTLAVTVAETAGQGCRYEAALRG